MSTEDDGPDLDAAGSSTPVEKVLPRCTDRGVGYEGRHGLGCGCDDFVVLRRCDVDALLEEWADLDEDPFWRPVENVCVQTRGATPSPPTPVPEEQQ